MFGEVAAKTLDVTQSAKVYVRRLRHVALLYSAEVRESNRYRYFLPSARNTGPLVLTFYMKTVSYHVQNVYRRES